MKRIFYNLKIESFLEKIFPFLICGFIALTMYFFQASKASSPLDASITIEHIREIFPEAKSFEKTTRKNDFSYVFNQNGKTIGKFLYTAPYVFNKGYGEDVHFIIGVDNKDKITGLHLVEHAESFKVVEGLQNNGFFNSWNGLNFKEAILNDVDAVSSATMTTQAVINGVKERLSLVSRFQVQKIEQDFDFKRFFLSFIVIVFAFLSFSAPKAFSKFRLGLLFSSILILGFINKDMLSLAQIFNWIQHGVNKFSMLIVIFGLAILLPLFTKRKFYCEYLCPYGFLQEVGSIWKKRNLQISQRLKGILKKLGWIYFWSILGSLFLGFSFFCLEAVEPFSAFLLKNAPSASLVIAILFFICAFFVPKMWCKYFCPTGKVFSLLQGEFLKDKRVYLRVFVLILFFSVLWEGIFFSREANNFKSIKSEEILLEDEKVPELKVASYWERLSSNVINCQLCPRRCQLKPGETGFCQARKNINGTLYALTYGKPVAMHADPIEKKPLAHVYPGTKSFSIATAGCNLRCKFCQNWEISQMSAEKVLVDFVAPEQIVAKAKQSRCKTIAFTYTEPTIFFEYMLDIAKIAKEKGVDCVMHSAGYIEEKPLRELAKYLTAANIDLKGFQEEFYIKFTQGSLKTVLNTLKILKEEGVWVEITNLLIPGVNDSNEEIRQMCFWVKENLGPQTPIHFSRFYPTYLLTNLSPTPLSSLLRAYKIAKEAGLYFVYIGNIPQQLGENTFCPNCENLLIKRIGYTVLENNVKDGMCPFCGLRVPGVWN